MYHPAIAETGDLLDARLRKGSVHTADGALSFILDLIDRAKTKLCQVAMVRMDAGFPEGLYFVRGTYADLPSPGEGPTASCCWIASG